MADTSGEASRQAQERAKSIADSALTDVRQAVSLAAGNLEKLPDILDRRGIGYVKENTSAELTSRSVTAVSVQNEQNLTVTLLIRSGGQASAGYDQVSTTVNACVDVHFAKGKPRDMSAEDVKCPQWVQEVVGSSRIDVIE
ncbi:hypothetical protein [Microbacterium sp. P05]|uniref:hypothetical protein n=1 Tax=Microbacterium sp. P05 TaxID=3366948 RepID=UPI0037474287